MKINKFFQAFLLVQLLLGGINCDEKQIQYERIIQKNAYNYEQNTQAELNIQYPGQVRGIYNYSIMQKKFQKKQETQASHDQICNIVTDQVTQPADLLNHITINELTDFQNSNESIIHLNHYNFNKDKVIYLLTTEKNVLQVKIEKQSFKLTGSSNFNEAFPQSLDKFKRPLITTSKYSQRIYIVGSTFIVSKPIEQEDKFSEIPFQLEKNYNNCYKVQDVQCFNEYIAISCYKDGLKIYKIGENKELVYVKSYFSDESVYQSYYSEQYKLLGFLNDIGVHFVKYQNGEFGELSKEFIVASYFYKNFNQYDFQTFWFFESMGTHILEVFADTENKIQDFNGKHMEKKKGIIGSYLNDIYGIVFYEDSFSVYIHSIPKSQVSEQREQIANFALEDTKNFIVIEGEEGSDQIFIFSVTEKSLKLNVLQFQPPKFVCEPREDTGTYEYKLRIFSKECEQQNSKELFYQCIIEDEINVKVSRSYVTSSQQKLVITIGLLIALFFILIILIFLYCYRRKKLDLDQIEEKVRNLRKIKYEQLDKENQIENVSNQQ